MRHLPKSSRLKVSEPFSSIFARENKKLLGSIPNNKQKCTCIVNSREEGAKIAQLITKTCGASIPASNRVFEQAEEFYCIGCFFNFKAAYFKELDRLELERIQK